MIKVAIYARVSTEEQAIHGYSIEKQLYDLNEYAKKHNYEIIDTYIDDGISARKVITKRTQFMRLLEDVKHRRFELIIFTKLDRWFRNVREYYKVQEVLEQNHVQWKAIYEQYETTTSNGRLHVNVILSVSESEADKASERIKKSFELKVLKGEAITGTQPFGYKIQDKKVVIDEKEAEIVRDLFNHYEKSCSVNATYNYYKNTYNDPCSYNKVANLLNREIYTGKYRDNENYCEPIISKEQFERVQNIPKHSFVRKNQTNRIYIFSSLVICKECNRRMVGTHKKYNDMISYYRYRCNNATIYKSCIHTKCINENFIEDYLLSNLFDLAKEDIDKAKLITTKKKKNRNNLDVNSIKAKLTKLKDLYLNDLITLEDYKIDFQKYNSLLTECEKPMNKPKQNTSYLENLIQSNYIKKYSCLDRTNKQVFWKKIISSILVDSENQIKVNFIH